MAQHTDNQCDILTHIGCPQSVQKTAFPVLSGKKKKNQRILLLCWIGKNQFWGSSKNRQAYNSFGFGHLIKV